MSETQVLFIWSAILTISGASISWLINRIYKTLDEHDKKYEKLKDHMNNAYVRRDDYIAANTRIFEKLDQIYDKLDKKADK